MSAPRHRARPVPGPTNTLEKVGRTCAGDGGEVCGTSFRCARPGDASRSIWQARAVAAQRQTTSRLVGEHEGIIGREACRPRAASCVRNAHGCRISKCARRLAGRCGCNPADQMARQPSWMTAGASPQGDDRLRPSLDGGSISRLRNRQAAPTLSRCIITGAASSWRRLPWRPLGSQHSRASGCDLRGARRPVVCSLVMPIFVCPGMAGFVMK
jgi:hypothetical protein